MGLHAYNLGLIFVDVETDSQFWCQKCSFFPASGGKSAVSSAKSELPCCADSAEWMLFLLPSVDHDAVSWREINMFGCLLSKHAQVQWERTRNHSLRDFLHHSSSFSFTIIDDDSMYHVWGIWLQFLPFLFSDPQYQMLLRSIAVESVKLPASFLRQIVFKNFARAASALWYERKSDWELSRMSSISRKWLDYKGKGLAAVFVCVWHWKDACKKYI